MELKPHNTFMKKEAIDGHIIENLIGFPTLQSMAYLALPSVHFEKFHMSK
jgi:hypothetical protein